MEALKRLYKLINKMNNYFFRKVCPELYVRPMIQFCKNHLDGKLIGAEIGSCHGINAKSILESLPIEKLYLVDPYEAFKYDYGTKRNTWNMNGNDMQKAKENLKNHTSKIEFIKKYSDIAAVCIPNHLDFVYIDGNHDYQYVKQDLELYYPKVVDGGVLGGHDFYGNFQGVVRAVIEFTEENNLKLNTSHYDWWVVK